MHIQFTSCIPRAEICFLSWYQLTMEWNEGIGQKLKTKTGLAHLRVSEDCPKFSHQLFLRIPVKRYVFVNLRDCTFLVFNEVSVFSRNFIYLKLIWFWKMNYLQIFCCQGFQMDSQYFSSLLNIRCKCNQKLQSQVWFILPDPFLNIKYLHIMKTWQFIVIVVFVMKIIARWNFYPSQSYKFYLLTF